jgi:hypothetical protein
MGRILIIIGIILIIVGLLSYVVPLFKLPGDIKYEGENFKIYFPIVTCIILSILLTILFNIFRK